MATRFFYLATASPHNLGNGGVPRWASGWQDYNYPGNDVKGSGWFKITNPYSGGGMPQYAVTQNTALVPLGETGIPVELSYSDPFPHYYPSSFGGSQCAYNSGGHPQDYSSATEPNSSFYFLRPFANFVYQLRGTGSINRDQFLAINSDANAGTVPPTAYTKLRLDAWESFLYIIWRHRVLAASIGPATCYIYRPGTGVVSVIFTENGSSSGYMPNNYFGPPMQREYADTVGATHRNFSHLWQYGRSYNSTFAWQDGDLLVWEMWATASGLSLFEDTTSASKTIAFVTGGGTSGQPDTSTGGWPNYAPAWRSVGTITGYEPIAARPSQVSVGF